MKYIPIEFDTEKDREDYFRTEYTEILGELVVGTLIGAGFLTAPASTMYHGAYPGGLFDHSVNVAHTLAQLTKNNNLMWLEGSPERSPFVVGILHDLCKIDQYKLEFPEIEQGYTYSNDPIIKGHGLKSIIYAQFMGARLSEEERACIAYHMGAFTDKKEWNDYTHAVNAYPNVLWTHTADMIASHIMEV